MRFWPITRGLLLSLLVATLVGCSEDDAASVRTLPDVDLHAVDGTLLQGGQRGFAAYQGRTLIINFWATWCLPCREEMPDLQRLSELLDAKRFAVIGVAVDKDLNLVREFLLKYQIGFDQFVDPDMRLAGDTLQVEFFPETLVVGPSGKIQKRIVGARAWSELSYIQALLGQDALGLSENE